MELRGLIEIVLAAILFGVFAILAATVSTLLEITKVRREIEGGKLIDRSDPGFWSKSVALPLPQPRAARPSPLSPPPFLDDEVLAELEEPIFNSASQTSRIIAADLALDEELAREEAKEVREYLTKHGHLPKGVS